MFLIEKRHKRQHKPETAKFSPFYPNQEMTDEKL